MSYNVGYINQQIRKFTSNLANCVYLGALLSYDDDDWCFMANCIQIQFVYFDLAIF